MIKIKPRLFDQVLKNLGRFMDKLYICGDVREFYKLSLLRGREGMRIEPIVTRDIFLRLCPEESDPFRYANISTRIPTWYIYDT